MRVRQVVLAVVCGLVAVVGASTPAAAVSYTTVERTIQDCEPNDEPDNLLEFAPGEPHLFIDERVKREEDCERSRRGPDEISATKEDSIVHFLQLTDFQLIDEESPGRVEFIDTTQRGLVNPFSAAYRPQESLTTQTTEAMVRQARNTVSPITQEALEFSILTGDNADSQQFNETRWFIDILDGTTGNEPNPAPENERTPNNSDHKIDPDSGIPSDVDPHTKEPPDPPDACDATPGSRYDGVRAGGARTGYYEPDESPGDNKPDDDGDGYSPRRGENASETGRDVTVRDFPSLFDAAQQPFEALGLAMPWYSAFGNHDALIQGNSPDAYIGPGGPEPEPNVEKANEAYQRFVTGCAKPSKLPPGLAPDDATDIFGNPALFEQSSPLSVPPDHRRCYLAKDATVVREPLGTDACQPREPEAGWIGEHFRTTGTPVGHGFAPSPAPPDEQACRDAPERDDCVASSYGRPLEARLNNDGYYSFSPRTGLRLVALDTVTDECGASICSEGSVDDQQFQWLRRELTMAAALGQYVMVYSHHSLRTTRQPNPDPTEQTVHYGERVDRDNPANAQNPSGAETLEELFCEHPNVLAHITGHEHENEVRNHRCAREAIAPTPGAGRFIEITTAAHVDWPQQSRLVELIDGPEQGTMSLVLTMLDHEGTPNAGNARPCREDDGGSNKVCFEGAGDAGEQVQKLASIGRELTYNDYQQNRGSRGNRKDRNVIVTLDRPWPYSSDAAPIRR